MSTSFIFHSLQRYLKQNNDRQLRKFCRSLHPLDMASSLERMPTREAAGLLDRLEPEYSSRVLAHMNSREQADTVFQLPENTLDQIVRAVLRQEQNNTGSPVPQECGRRLLQTLSRTGRGEPAGMLSSLGTAVEVA